jgi:hypothetical protein
MVESDIPVTGGLDLLANIGKHILGGKQLSSRLWIPNAPEPSRNDSGESGERCPSPRRHGSPSGFWYPAQRFASRVDPRAREPGYSTSHGGPGSLPIEMVYRERISFHARQPVLHIEGALRINAGRHCFPGGSV